MKILTLMIGVKPAFISTLRRKTGTARAFTLIEALVAAVIGSIIFTSIYAGISNGFSLLNTSRANLRATQIIISRMEGLRLCAWGNGTNQVSQLFDTNLVSRTFTDYFYPQGMNGQPTNYGTPYSGIVTVTNATLTPAASYATNMVLVTVTVSWADGFAGHTNTHSRSMSTYVSQYGIQNYIYNR